MTAERGREITVDEAAAILGASPRTVRRWCKAGKLEGRQVDRGNGRALAGREWRVVADSVQALAAELAAGASPADTTRKPEPAKAARPLNRVDSRLSAEIVEFREQQQAIEKKITDLQDALAALPGEQKKIADALTGQLANLSAQVEPVLRALPAASEEREAVQAALEQQAADREKITDALGSLQELVTAQAEQIATLRAELQDARRPWWRRWFREGPG